MKGSGANKANTLQTHPYTYSHPLDLSAVAKTNNYFFHLILFFFFLLFLFCSPHFPSSSFLLIPPPPLLFSRSAVLLIPTAHSTPKSFLIHPLPYSLHSCIFSFFPCFLFHILSIMSGILRLAASSRSALLKPSTLVRSAGIHRHAIQVKSAPKIVTPFSGQAKKASLAMPAIKMMQQRAYHDDGAYGYRVPKVYSMPDCK